MVKSKTQPVVSKIGPQNAIGIKYFIFSKIKGTIAASVNSEFVTSVWSCGLEFDDEKRALQEYDWLSSRSFLREYLVVKAYDGLDDEIPF
jgi:hypothetical protein